MKEKLRCLLRAVLAGFCIGLGGFCFLSVEQKVVGAFLFGIGLFVICTRGYDLFTGKVCYAARGGDFVNLLIIALGNLLGTNLLGLLIRLTRVSAAVSGRAAALAETKLNDSPLSVFLLAIVCNIFIFIAVDGYRNCPHTGGKYISLFLGVAGFIVCGTEHVVANMFYFAVAGVYSWRAALCLLITLAGNSLGGWLFAFADRFRAEQAKK